MPKWRCNTCGGEYFDTLLDGKRYFHVCPQTPNPKHQPDPALPDFDPRETIQREDKRDERSDPREFPGTGKIRAEGKGRRPIPPHPWEEEWKPPGPPF